MWKLVNVKKENCESYLFVGEKFVVGRMESSLLIEWDLTVSRKHALLHIKHPEENLEVPSKSSSLYMKDLESKVGSFKNGVRVTSEVELNENDVIRFGLFSEFRVERVPLVVTGSCLNTSTKKELKQIIHMLGGHFTPEWHSLCTHLIMSEVFLTVKALCSLSSAKPIVTPEYFQQLKQRIRSSNFLLPNKFIPPNGESLIEDKISFDVNSKRKMLFKNTTFFFIDDLQLKKLHLCIELAGGNVSMLTSENINPEIMLQDYCCVIKPMTMESNHHIDYMLPHIRFLLQKKNLKLIHESEIGLAIANCSSESFCNPNFIIDSMETPVYSTVKNKLCNSTSENQSENGIASVRLNPLIYSSPDYASNRQQFYPSGKCSLGNYSIQDNQLVYSSNKGNEKFDVSLKRKSLNQVLLTANVAVSFTRGNSNFANQEPNNSSVRNFKKFKNLGLYIYRRQGINLIYNVFI